MSLLLKAILTTLVYSTTSLICLGQDISGKWTGNYDGFLGIGKTRKLTVEITIINDSIIKGTSYLKYGGDRHEKYVINGVYHRYDSTVYFSEDKEISVDVGAIEGNVMGSYDMKLSIEDSIMILEGNWEEQGKGFFKIMNSSVWLEKELPTEARKGTKKKATSIENLTSKQEKLDRGVDVQKTIEISKEEQNNILVEFRDNARIDNDIISVYLNDTLAIDQQRISDIPIQIHFSLSGQDTTMLKVAADSYGAMPPCTTQMTVTTSKHKYVVDLSSSFDKNATVNFVVKE